MSQPPELTPEVLQAIERATPTGTSGPPAWTTETSEAVRHIGTVLQTRCPNWAWAPWQFTPPSDLIAHALIDAGYKAYDKDGEDIAYDPQGEAAARIQTIMWDAHYTGDRMEDATKGRVVSDGRPENGGIFPIITVGPPNAEEHAEDIAMMLESWERRYATLPESVVPVTKASGSGPVSGVMAWACGICSTVVRQAPDGTMPSFVCPGCGATQNWRQPTIDELANVSPTERAAMNGAQPYGLGLPVVPTQQPRQSDNDYYAGVQQQQGSAQMPDPETRAIADICWLLEQLPPQAQQRVVRYVKDRWS